MKKYSLGQNNDVANAITTMLDTKPAIGEFVSHEGTRYKVVWVLHENHKERTMLGVKKE